MGVLDVPYIVQGLTVGSNAWLIAVAAAEAYSEVDTIVRDTNGAITSCNVVWPDGTAGVYTTVTASTAFPGLVDAYTVTYLGTTTKTVTQELVTRDTNGAITSQPQLIVS